MLVIKIPHPSIFYVVLSSVWSAESYVTVKNSFAFSSSKNGSEPLYDKIFCVYVFWGKFLIVAYLKNDQVWKSLQIKTMFMAFFVASP